MIQGFVYSGGPFDILWGRPASAFSKGDIVQLDSTSSVSRINILMTSDIYGVADAGSDQSINNLVPILIPTSATEFLASVDTTASTLTPGVECDVLFGAGNGRHYITSSANSVRAVIKRGNAGDNALSQSNHSQAIVRLIMVGGEVELS